jgi:hypothetical protein
VSSSPEPQAASTKRKGTNTLQRAWKERFKEEFIRLSPRLERAPNDNIHANLFFLYVIHLRQTPREEKYRETLDSSLDGAISVFYGTNRLRSPIVLQKLSSLQFRQERKKHQSRKDQGTHRRGRDRGWNADLLESRSH